MKERIMSSLILLTAFGVISLVLIRDWVVVVSPLMKMFILFLGMIVGFQAIPAALFCSGVFRGIFKSATEETVNRNRNWWGKR